MRTAKRPRKPPISLDAQAHGQLAQLADEQAALRRVATLGGEELTPHRVFEAVRHEVARMFDTPLSVLMRYAHGTATVLATSGEIPGPIGSNWPVEHDSSPIARVCRTLAKFADLLATAIANTGGRAELDASRARIVAAADATRRRIERDLHDGAQQQLVWLALALRATQATVPEELEQHRSELDRVVEGLTTALDDLREIALGIHPAGLSEDGLSPALKRLVSRSPLRVNLDCRADGRFAEPVEVTAYYVVSEALTNAVKYADAPVVNVAVTVHDRVLRVAVRDDGCGGADPAEGSGLLGLKDRVDAVGGTMRLTSPPGVGTSLLIELPLVDRRARR
jgi:signal transduction histidine kinase